MHQYKTGSEAGQQEAFFDWLRWRCGSVPEAELAFHIPNGGKRNSAEAAHLKRQGVKAGVPDIFIPAARGGYHGLFIEMKYGKNRPTENQRQWLQDLAEQGYKTAVCYDWEEAADVFNKYMEADKNED